MILAMAAFAAEDSAIKYISEKMPLGQVLLILGLGGSLIYIFLGAIFRKNIFNDKFLTWPMHLRIIFEIIGRIFYSLSLAFTSLASTTIILQATPIVVVIGASIFFKERISLVRWIAIITGLSGVLIILQPGVDSFSIMSCFAIIGMFGFAARDLASRAAPKSLNIYSLGVHGFLSLAVAGLILLYFSNRSIVLPDIQTCGLLLISILFGVIGYGALIKAMRIGEVSAITPFRYTRLIFGISIGVILFNEKISFSIILGCLVIVISGIFVLYSQKHNQK